VFTPPGAVRPVDVFGPLGEAARQVLFGLVSRCGARASARIRVRGKGLKGAMKAATVERAVRALRRGAGLTADQVQLKDMESGEQVPVPIDQIISTIRRVVVIRTLEAGATGLRAGSTVTLAGWVPGGVITAASPHRSACGSASCSGGTRVEAVHDLRNEY